MSTKLNFNCLKVTKDFHTVTPDADTQGFVAIDKTNFTVFKGSDSIDIGLGTNHSLVKKVLIIIVPHSSFFLVSTMLFYLSMITWLNQQWLMSYKKE